MSEAVGKSDSQQSFNSRAEKLMRLEKAPAAKVLASRGT